MNYPTLLCVLLAFVLAMPTARAQQLTRMEGPNSPSLKLELIPVTKTYKIGEPLVVKYRLTSLVDGTLCFPVPAIGASGSFEGHIILNAQPIDPHEERDLFIEHFWPVRPDEYQLRLNISLDWIKLGMSEPYQVPKPDSRTLLKVDGKWLLQAEYAPPELTAREREVVKSMGCTPPQDSVKADPVTINVIGSFN